MPVRGPFFSYAETSSNIKRIHRFIIISMQICNQVYLRFDEYKAKHVRTKHFRALTFYKEQKHDPLQLASIVGFLIGVHLHLSEIFKNIRPFQRELHQPKK